MCEVVYVYRVRMKNETSGKARGFGMEDFARASDSRVEWQKVTRVVGCGTCFSLFTRKFFNILTFLFKDV